eukprot:1699487-Prymnesium_polylepis.1
MISTVVRCSCFLGGGQKLSSVRLRRRLFSASLCLPVDRAREAAELRSAVDLTAETLPPCITTASTARISSGLI